MKVGIIGGGQLGRMIALAGYPLGLRFLILDPAPDAPAGRVAEQLAGAFDDVALLGRLAAESDVVTYEFENVPADSARFVATLTPLYPSAVALEVAQDRLNEKALFTRLGIDTPAFAPADSPAALADALESVGTPAVVKTRRLGYDGKGQVSVHDPADAAAAWERLGGVPVIAESLVAFDRELSILAVRGTDGSTAAYPLVENHHHDGILRLSVAPAPAVAPALQARAEEYAARLLAEIDYVGILAMELFEVGERLLANEIAPRVHNSGHWTIEGARCSQFENHLRAIAGLPLGDTAARGHTAMLNLVGDVPKARDVLAVPGARLHLYDKQPRPGRKVGHITVVAQDPAERLAGLEALRELPGVGPLPPAAVRRP